MFGEFVPLIVGDAKMTEMGMKMERGKRSVYRKGADPSIRNAFSTAAYRFGHSLVQDHTKRIDLHDQSSISPEVEFPRNFFSFRHYNEDHGLGVDRLLVGMCETPSDQDADRFFSFVVRDKLFGFSNDLVATNVQRGRCVRESPFVFFCGA